MDNMTLEEALKRIEFLEKALNGAIDFAGIHQLYYADVGYVQVLLSNSEECGFEDEPELVEYIMERKNKLDRITNKQEK
jgi:hypothetical protein